MERKGLSMKNHHQRTNISMRNPTSNIMKSQSNHNNNIPKDHAWSHGYNSQSYEEDYIVNGFSWPPRSYSCSFCKREFRSAQALGGHMNVHRKDRARLRQSPPRDLARYGGTTFLNLNLNPNPNPNPNPNFSPSLLTTPLSSYSAYCPNNENKKWSWTSTTNHVEYGSTDHGQVLDPLAINGSDLARNVKNKQSVGGVGENEGFAGKTLYFKGLRKAAHETTTVRLDLEIGLVGSDSKMGRDLDLELRLGYSN